MSGFVPRFEDSGRSLLEIVEDAKGDVIPTHGECYYAMLALDALLTFAGWDSKRVAEAVLENKSRGSQEFAAHLAINEPFKREKAAFAKSPFQWLGIHNLPGHPEQVAFRKAAFGILKKIQGKP